jgi:PIN domain nuclease of toxin-antitoxin system
MKILIDTNILLMILFEDEKLSKNELKVINDEANEIFVTSISIFEISLKYSIGKLKLKNVTPDVIPEIIEKNGYNLEDTNYKTFSTFYKLPKNNHKDPFDRLIIWEAIQKNYHLLSRDGEFINYEKYGLKLIKST